LGGKSDFLELELLDHVLGNAAYTAPATVHLGLFTVTPSDTGGGTEVTGGSYARKAVTNNATNFPAAAAGSKSNGVAQSFVTATASWGTIVAFGVFDAATAGNLLWWGAISPTKVVDNGDTASFAIGALTFTED
jgi:hypothetical protein